MKILVLSDIHLSHHHLSAVQNGRRIDEQADVVVLAGDIDDGLGGFRWARETFEDKPIVMVAGSDEEAGLDTYESERCLFRQGTTCGRVC